MEKKPPTYSDVDFGDKTNNELDNCFMSIAPLVENNYNKGCDLQTYVEAYKSLHEYYPELFQCDSIYATSENHKYLKINACYVAIF